MFKTLLLEKDDRGVATLRLNRPEKHNAMSGEMLSELIEASRQISKDPSTRVVILTGVGKSFCAGGDLAWMRAQRKMEPALRIREARKLAEMLQALNSLPQPLIGKIQGNAFGGGVGMACVCDVAIGFDGLKMGLTETRLGLIPATIGPYVVSRMGEAKARRVFMSARIFDAAEAVRLNLLADSVTASALDDAIENEVEPYLSCAPRAVARAKSLIRYLGTPIDDAVVDYTINELVACWQDEESEEGTRAFFEKRMPTWAQTDV